jgi:hypothetical protein
MSLAWKSENNLINFIFVETGVTARVTPVLTVILRGQGNYFHMASPCHLVIRSSDHIVSFCRLVVVPLAAALP